MQGSMDRAIIGTSAISQPGSIASSGGTLANVGVRMRTRRVCNWPDGQMVLRWATAAFLETEKHFQKIGG